uniref:Uncharacterized protein n=1 Tax=Leersia perrieri TaxID=77586 RepID=A0A0D9VUE9_9ORYZ
MTNLPLSFSSLPTHCLLLPCAASPQNPSRRRYAAAAGPARSGEPPPHRTPARPAQGGARVRRPDAQANAPVRRPGNPFFPPLLWDWADAAVLASSGETPAAVPDGAPGRGQASQLDLSVRCEAIDWISKFSSNLERSSAGVMRMPMFSKKQVVEFILRGITEFLKCVTIQQVHMLAITSTTPIVQICLG